MTQEIILKYMNSSTKAVNWLASQINDDGSYSVDTQDLACYYKSPYLFYISGKTELANRILNYIKNQFLRANGDLTTQENYKSENGAFAEYWAYINGWIAIAAQKMGRFDVAYPVYQYLSSFYYPKSGGFTTNKPFQNGENVVDVLTTAHLGLTCLYFGDLERAKNAGKLLDKFMNIQPDIKSGFYLRMNDEEKLILDFYEDVSLFFQVSATHPNQAYFMIGYPLAFLANLYRSSGDKFYLNTANKYLDFAWSCYENIRSFYFSHKVAWGAAIIANLTGEIKAVELSKSIADYLLSIQTEAGAWLTEQPAYSYFDQTTEIAIWLREIATEISKIC